MAEVQTPLPLDTVSSVKEVVAADKNVLIDRLDALLEQYLNTLDEYEKLMQQLSKQLSSAYFSLTQANFHNRSGVHYGQDSYDQRVQATRNIVVTNDDENKLHYSTISTLPSPPSRTDANSHTGEKEENQQTEDAAEAPNKPQDKSTESEPKEDKTETETPRSPAPDPIRMFGILVPPALRSAQASFRDAVDGPVVRLAQTKGELRALEREIGRARKAVRKSVEREKACTEMGE